MKNIYTGKIKNWKEVVENDALITPYIRNKNSGSQELIESLVLKGEQIPEDFPEDGIVYSMLGLFTDIYVVIRSDLEKSSMAYKIYELMQTMAGKKVIEESGYVPNSMNRKK